MKKHTTAIFIIILTACALASSAFAVGQSSANYRIPADVIAGGGGGGGSINYDTEHTTAQSSAIGESLSANYHNFAGFQYALSGADAVITLYEETNPAINYTGTWNNYACAACSSGAVKYSGQSGAKASLTFIGSGIKWIAAKSTQLGKPKVYVDNVLQTTVDLYSSPATAKQIMYQKTGLTNSSHIISIEFTGTKNIKSTGSIIDLDAFEVVP